ncbi:TPA: hypothetical protein N0F65_001497 [Lagenidium giganteum]|uniref:PX domain-containing protein n=1 Tax=Lagenidium giganteum TaxID=4803 RepID=A0AAV2Z3F9_9STRA|nr:TPA: hypothetical protein N0F65_001497 [Lagenidium giganteum]
MRVHADVGAEAEPPLAVQILGFKTEEKQEFSLRKTRFVYEVETCNLVTGEVYVARRRYREFKRLRDALLEECQTCAYCNHFVESLKHAPLPHRAPFVVNSNKYGAHQARKLTHFLRDLVRLVAMKVRHCKQNGHDVDRSVGLFLGVHSLEQAERSSELDRASAWLGPKTREERAELRPASLADFRFSSLSLAPSESDQDVYRSRGFSAA